MLYKDDWETIKKRYEAWWEGSMLDRAMIQAIGPRSRPSMNDIPQIINLKDRWLDSEIVFKSGLKEIESTYYGGDAFPYFWPNLGPDVFASILGSEMVFREDTTWVKPFVENWDNYEFVLDENNLMWKKVVELTSIIAQESNGRYVCGVTDLHPSLDCLAAMRGAENLCIDLIEDAQIVKKKLMEVTAVFKEIYSRLSEIIDKTQYGTTTTLPVWHPGKYFINCCDFIYMISNEMFHEYALPVVIEELQFFDATIFHLDGVAALTHLDSILDLHDLKAVQFVYGDGQPSARNWIHIYKKIQKAGKSLYLYGPPEDVEILLNELEPEGFLYLTFCNSEEDVDELVRMVERLSYKRKVF